MQSIGKTFFSSDQKYRTLNKDSQMIEMKTEKINSNGDYEYQTFIECQYSENIQNSKTNQGYPTRIHANNKSNNKNSSIPLNPPFYTQPNVPYKNPYYNSGKDDMVLNGMKFKIVQDMQPNSNKLNQKKTHKKNIPSMDVTCVFCMKDQKIDGTQEQYTCYHCGNNNGCTPMYNIVKCQNCQTKVCYRYFTSDLVKCTKCNYVNKVPKWAKNAHVPIEIKAKQYHNNYQNNELISQKSLNYHIEYPEFLSENGDEKKTGRQ